MESFTLRTDDGLSQVFLVGATEIDGEAFPPNHLREHMGLAEPIVVTYAEDGADLVATRLEDAALDE